MPAYLFQGQRLTPADPGFAEALAMAQAECLRPRCLCQSDGVPMYVARLGGRFVLKRMPLSGCLHAPDCKSYELPPGMSGLARLLGTAIAENPVTGITSLKLGFALSRHALRSCDPYGIKGTRGHGNDGGARLTLRGLLHYLWDEAELTHWQPSFAGRRSWVTVRRRLLSAVEGKIARGHALIDRIYVPEPFSASCRVEIAERRAAQWGRAFRTGTAERQLLILVGEVKEVRETRLGHRAVVKNVPDFHFAMSDETYRWVTKRFASELSLWDSTAGSHLLMIATLGLSNQAMPKIEELSLMPTNDQWIPIEDGFDLQLVERLVQQRRQFRKTLRYDNPTYAVLPEAVLLDTAGPPTPLFVSRLAAPSPSGNVDSHESSGAWTWHVVRSPIPSLP
jgi:hypothetical protein